MADITPGSLALALSRMHVTVGAPVLCDPAPDAPEGSAQGVPLYPESLARMLLADIAGQDSEEVPASECSHCGDRITLLGGAWTTEDGTTACTDTSAPYVPHKPASGVSHG